MCKGETREVSPSPVWDDLIHAGYVRVIPEEKAEKPETKPAGKETKKNGSTKGKTSVQRRKRING